MSSRPSRSLSGALGTLPFATLALLAVACDGGAGSVTDASVERPTGGSGGAGGGTGGTLGGGGRGGSGSDASFEVAPPPPPPPINPNAKKLLPARSQMLGLHRSSCSYGATSMAAGATRWCAISRPGTTLGTLELWVMNVTKAAASPAGTVKCEGAGDADCIKLSSNLFGAQPEAGPVYPTAHRFYGDTLIYYANAKSAPSELYKGPVYAWKPGWTEGKQIGSDNAVLCSGHSRADVAVCIENISAPGVEPVTWDIHAGKIDGGPMKKVSQIFPVHPVTEASQWGSGFTATGDHFIFSTPTSATVPAGMRETLFFIPTASIGTAMPTQVDIGVSRWTLSADGTKWFYMKDYNYNVQGEPSGTLYIRDFPMGATDTRIIGTEISGGAMQGVGTYQVLFDSMDKDAGLGVLTKVVGGRGNYRLLKNPSMPPDTAGNTIKVIDDISTLPVYSDDLRFHYYGKQVDEMVGTTDSWVIKVNPDGTTAAPCSLTTSLASSIFGFPFNQSGGLVFWMDNFDSATDSGEGWVGNPDGCTAKRKFSDAIDFWFVDGDKALLYSDNSDGRFVSLRYATAVGTTLGTPVELQKQTDRLFAVLPNYEGLMFGITSSNPEADGVYYLPLPPGAAPAGDAGAPDAAPGN